MNFTSELFLLIFLIVHILTQIFVPSRKGKNICLLLASLVFYLWAGVVSLLLVAGISLVIWFIAGRLPNREESTSGKLLYVLGVLIPVIFLIVFKYSDFIAGSFQAITGSERALTDIVIPIGIGVYTLRLISYLSDVYHKKTRPESDFLSFLTFSSLFFGVSAGPLFAYRPIRKALKIREIRMQGISSGISRICLGIAKKYLLADSLASVVDLYLVRSSQGLSAVPITGLWFGICLSAIRLYLLYSAYNDMSAGLCLISGFPVQENFRYPLMSAGVTTFISRWFISPGNFFRSHTARFIEERTGNRFLSFLAAYLLMGLWFGGSWSFAVWGILVAVFLILENRVIRKLPSPFSGLLGFAGMFLTFAALSFTTLERLGIAAKGLIGLNGNGFFSVSSFENLPGSLLLIVLCILFCIPVGTFIRNAWNARFESDSFPMKAAAFWENIWPILLLIAAVVVVAGGFSSTFLIF